MGLFTGISIFQAELNFLKVSFLKNQNGFW